MEFIKYDSVYKESFINCFLLFGKNRWYNLENLDLIFSNLEKKLLNTKYLFLCIKNKEVIWFIWWKIKETDNIFSINKKIWHILYLFINDNYKWNGFSSILKNILFDEFRKEKISSFSLNVRKINSHAIVVYKKWWFNESKKMTLINNKN